MTYPPRNQGKREQIDGSHPAAAFDFRSKRKKEPIQSISEDISKESKVYYGSSARKIVGFRV